MSAHNILEYLEKTAQRVPERTAFSDEAGEMTFAALLSLTKAIGSAVAQRVKPRQPVVLLFNDRSIACVSSMLGVVYAGCPYVPLDAGQPAERLCLIADSLQPALVIYDERGSQAAKSFSCPQLAYDNARQHPIDTQVLSAIRAQADEGDPMAIMYTSGSTGIPKGVVQSMRSHLRFTQATIDKYGFTEGTVFANQSPFFYANAIIDIFPTLALGARTVILPATALAFPRTLIELLNAHQATELTMTPSSYVKVASSGLLEKGCLPFLQYCVLSGEAANWATLEKWLQAAPQAAVWNFYGSTELYSVAVLRLKCAYADAQVIPVGPVYDGVEIRFVDDEGMPAAQGEMLIHTPWLADGYYHDDARTKASFFVAEDGRRFYRSGDLGRMNPDHQLEVLGRRDTQIKHMGYRMEIGETELALLSVEGVQAGCCLFDRNSGMLHCFYSGRLTAKELTAALKKKLPRFALPDQYHQMEQLPYTANMKIDRRALMSLLP